VRDWDDREPLPDIIKRGSDRRSRRAEREARLNEGLKLYTDDATVTLFGRGERGDIVKRVN
jgi:hypothetical protein